MDFEVSPEAAAVRQIAGQVLSERSSAAHLAELDRGGQWFDRHTYDGLAAAGVLSAALPKEFDGAGLGPLELHEALELAGQHVAQIPLFESVVLGGVTLARHGTPEQRRAWLPGVGAGRVVLTAALTEPGHADPRAPLTGAVAADGGWRLRGRKSQVPLATLAERILVPAATDDGTIVVVLLDPRAAGVTLTEQRATGHRPCALLDLDDVAVGAADLVGIDGAAVLADLLLRAESGLASLQGGVCLGALRMAAGYVGQRHQFGRPLSSFQAVRQRLADAFIDAEAVRLTALQAAWRLSAGLDATAAVGIARWWAAEGGHRVLHAAQHVHGGIGLDLDYPLHRYFRLGKQLEFALGSAAEQLSRLGRALAEAADPAVGGTTDPVGNILERH
jgi:alkylation response protein AidB-like acyl-CoA dehydrogenase